MRYDRPVRCKRERGEIAVTRPFAEFRNRIDVFDIVSQRFEATGDLVFYVLVEKQSLRHFIPPESVVRGR